MSEGTSGNKDKPGGKPPYKPGGKPPYKGGKTQQQGGRPQRGPPLSPAQQRRRASEERISKWSPKTELGKMVVSGEVTTIDQALASGLPLREPPMGRVRPVRPLRRPMPVPGLFPLW